MSQIPSQNKGVNEAQCENGNESGVAQNMEGLTMKQMIEHPKETPSTHDNADDDSHKEEIVLCVYYARGPDNCRYPVDCPCGEHVENTCDDFGYDGVCQDSNCTYYHIRYSICQSRENPCGLRTKDRPFCDVCRAQFRQSQAQVPSRVVHAKPRFTKDHQVKDRFNSNNHKTNNWQPRYQQSTAERVEQTRYKDTKKDQQRSWRDDMKSTATKAEAEAKATDTRMNTSVNKNNTSNATKASSNSKSVHTTGVSLQRTTGTKDEKLKAKNNLQNKYTLALSLNRFAPMAWGDVDEDEDSDNDN